MECTTVDCRSKESVQEEQLAKLIDKVEKMQIRLTEVEESLTHLEREVYAPQN